MINSNRENLQKLTGRKRIKDIVENHRVQYQSPMQLIKEPRIHEVERFHMKLKRDRRRNQHRFILILGLTLIILMVILYWVVTADYSEVIEVIN